MTTETPLPPLVAPRPPEERPAIDWDRPIGYSHADALLRLLR